MPYHSRENIQYGSVPFMMKKMASQFSWMAFNLEYFEESNIILHTYTTCNYKIISYAYFLISQSVVHTDITFVLLLI